MSSEQLLNVKFVKAVEARPCLWDNKSKTYRNREFVTNAWGMISAQFLEPVDSCRERWRNIRNAFLRSMKRTPDDLSKRKNYYLTSHLQFLMPFVKNQQTDTKDFKVHDFGEDIKPEPFQVESPTNEFDEETKASQPPLHQSKFIAESTSRYTEIVKEPPALDRGLAKKRKKEENVFQDDRNMAFFKSLLWDVRQMNDRQNRKFRLNVMQVVNEILDGEEEKPIDDFN